MSIMLHITYNYALQTIQALSCQGYTHSMSPPTMACSAARLFSISVSRGYCPGSTINTFNHLPHPFSGLIIVQHLYFHCYNHGSRTFPFAGTSYQCQKAFFCLWLIPGSRQHSTSKSKVILIVCKPGSVKRNPRQIRCQNRYNTVFLNAILRFE